MSKSRSTSKSHDSFNRNIIKKEIEDLFDDDYSSTNPDYIRFNNCLKLWLSTINLSSMNEKEIQLDFFQNCMKKYDQFIDNRLKYGDEFKGTIYKALFERFMPDFCLVDFYNSHVRSSSSGLDLEFLPLHIVSILELKTKLKDSDIEQLINDLRIVLDYSPSSRLFIIGAMTDFRSIRFAKVSRSNDADGFQYIATIKPFEDDIEYLFHYLTLFFTLDQSKLGHHRLEFLPNSIRIDKRLLGIGANSMVFSCLLINDQSHEYVLKISNNFLEKEVSIYQKLYGEQYRIVQVHQYAFLFLHPPGQVVSTENLFNNVVKLWNQIRKAHRCNILHRDIRKSNVIEMFNDKTQR